MDKESWIKRFDLANHDGDISELHQLRKEIYAETLKVCMCGYYCVGGNEITLSDTAIMMEGSCLYQDLGATSVLSVVDKTEITVIQSDSLTAGKGLLDEGLNPIVLNFANRQTPGGGVLRGSGAQEENIFRRSNLAFSLYQYHSHAEIIGIKQRAERYPLDRNTGGVYSPHVCVFRGGESEGYPLLPQPYALAIVTVAALNRPKLKDQEHLDDKLVIPTLRKMRTIFRIALKHGHDSIVLGAWGCGAFANPPRHIAELFREVLYEDEFVNRFKKVVFAILDRKYVDVFGQKRGNYGVFKDVLEKAQVQLNPSQSVEDVASGFIYWLGLESSTQTTHLSRDEIMCLAGRRNVFLPKETLKHIVGVKHLMTLDSAFLRTENQCTIDVFEVCWDTTLKDNAGLASVAYSIMAAHRIRRALICFFHVTPDTVDTRLVIVRDDAVSLDGIVSHCGVISMLPIFYNRYLRAAVTLEAWHDAFFCITKHQY